MRGHARRQQAGKLACRREFFLQASAMRVSPTLLLALAAVCALPHARAEDPAKIDPTQKVDQLAPSADTAKTVGKVELKRDDQVQAGRATLPGVIQEPTAPLSGRTAPIEVTE